MQLIPIESIQYHGFSSIACVHRHYMYVLTKDAITQYTDVKYGLYQVVFIVTNIYA